MIEWVRRFMRRGRRARDVRELWPAVLMRMPDIATARLEFRRYCLDSADWRDLTEHQITAFCAKLTYPRRQKV